MDTRSQQHRRRMLAEMAGARIQREIYSLVDRDGLSYGDAEKQVFADVELLARCHDVAGVPLPAPPQSPIEAQNG